MKTKLFTALIALSMSHSVNAQWKGQGEAGFISANGNTDSQTLNVGLKFINEGPVWSHEFGANTYRAENDGDVDAQSYDLGYTAKRALTERSNIFFDVGFLDDDFDGFTEQTSVGIGYGYKIIDTEPVGWETGIGIGYLSLIHI